jgi:hypothetical protein
MKGMFCRPTLLAGPVVLAVFTLFAALAAATRSAGATLSPADSGIVSPYAPSAVADVILPHSTAAYNGVMTPSTTLYAPWMLGGTSSIRVFNTSMSAATVRATFDYNPGAPVEAIIEPRAVGDIRTTNVPTATRFSAIVTATQPIVAVVNDFGPNAAYATSYAAMPAEEGRTYFTLADILNYGDLINSEIAVQNVSESATHVTITYTRTDVFTTSHWSETFLNLSPGQTHIFHTKQAGLPADFAGIATVRASQSVVAAVNNPTFDELGALHPDQAYVYQAPLPGAGVGSDLPLHFPLLVNAFESWQRSEIQMVNTAAASANFTLEIAGATYDKSLEGWSAQSYLQTQAGSASPIGEAVAGRVQNVQSLEGLVWLNGQGNFRGDFLAAYSAARVGGSAWYLPYTDQGDSFATYVAVQNLSSTIAHITLTHHTVTGTLGLYVGSIPGLETVLYTGGSGIPLNFSGGVVVEADQSVAAVTVIAGQLILDKELYLPIVSRQS